MKNRILLVFCAFFTLAVTSFSDGYIIPRPRPRPMPKPLKHLTVNYHKVYVAIENQLVTTRVEQEFHNPNSRIFEGDYIFPIPKGAVITDFAIWENGKKLKGEILKADEARKIYQDIVRQMRDPGLLEFQGTDTYRVRVFPIQPKANKKIEIEYTQMLKNENGLMRYQYPLKIEALGREKIKEVLIQCSIDSDDPIKNIYSSTHDISLPSRSEKSAKVSFESNNFLPDKDFVLYYSVSSDNVGINLLTYKDGDDDGYFIALFAPKHRIDKNEIQPKNIIFVIDRSGSMSGEKIVQAKAGLKFCVENLNENDHFNIIAFSDYRETLSKWPIKASKANLKKGLDFIKNFNATGGTDINSALKEALEMFEGKSKNYIIFLTDGLATVGEQKEEKIIQNISKANDVNARIFVWGVGYDVNTHLLDRCANDNKGASEYIEPKENIEIKISNFYSKIQNPFLSDLKFSVGKIETYDIFPKTLPDLFAGSQLVITGRYKSSGSGTMQLSGTVNDKQIFFKKKVQFPGKDLEKDTIPYIWASRKIGYLTEQVRLSHNKELIDEIIRLSKKFGIVTEYTSFLARADAAGAGVKEERRMFDSMAEPAMEKKSGMHAVKQSKKIGKMKSAQVAQKNVYYDAEGDKVEVDTLANVAQQSFVKSGNEWQSLDIEKDKDPDIIIEAFSEAYFQIAQEYPGIIKYLSLGNNITIKFKGKILKISEKEGKKTLTKKELRIIWD